MPVTKKPAGLPAFFQREEALTLAGRFSIESVGGIEVLDRVRQGKKTLLSAQGQGTARKAFLRAASSKYVLKEFPWYVSDPDFPQAVTKLQTRLKTDFGLPIPAYVPAMDTKGFFVRSEGHQISKACTLQEMVPCISWSGTMRQMKSSAKLLKKLHQATTSICAEGETRAFPKENVFDSTLDLLDIGRAELMRDRKHQFSETDMRKLDRLIDVYKDKVLSAKEDASRHGYSSAQILVHGDFHQNNVLFKSHGEVAGLVDFDNCCLDHPVNDVARMILSSCFFNVSEGQHPFGSIPQSMDQKKAGVFLAEYKKDNAHAETVTDNLKYAARAVALQLSFLGILTGGYKAEHLEELGRIPDRIDSAMNTFIEHLAATPKTAVRKTVSKP